MYRSKHFSGPLVRPQDSGEMCVCDFLDAFDIYNIYVFILIFINIVIEYIVKMCNLIALKGQDCRGVCFGGWRGVF